MWFKNRKSHNIMPLCLDFPISHHFQMFKSKHSQHYSSQGNKCVSIIQYQRIKYKKNKNITFGYKTQERMKM